MTKTEENINTVIEQPYKVPELILDGKSTKTTHFLLPALNITHVKMFGDYFVNAFIGDAKKESFIRFPIFLLFRTKAFDEKWKAFEYLLKNSPRSVYEYDVGVYEDFNLVMFVFEFPISYRADYNKFLDGKYSEFSDGYKANFKENRENIRGQTVYNVIHGVIHKTPFFKTQLEKVIDATIEEDQEFWEKLTPEREIFRKPKT